MRKLRPVVASKWWLIGENPDLCGILPGAEELQRHWEAAGRRDEHNSAVDHHIFRDERGLLHLWGCLRHTAVGRVLYHWTSSDLRSERWHPMGEIIRADRNAGESVRDWSNEEWLQSPYFVRHDGTYYMFYGGHSTGCRQNGEPIEAAQLSLSACQMCLMTSKDGLTWTRHRNGAGQSRIFVGPGEVRDPCVLRVGAQWLCYYAGFSNEDMAQHAFYVRRSPDLIHWSDPTTVLRDPREGKGPWSTECPHVVFREGYYYLFRTENYYEAITHVYRSTDPLDFGVDPAAARDKYVCDFPAAAVEIYEFDGKEYVSSSHDPKTGEFLAELAWESDEQ